MTRKQAALISGLALATLVGAAWGLAGQYTDLLANNRVSGSATRACASEADCERYRDLFIADAHADTLLHRDPSRPSSRGHVDLFRLIDAGVDLQVFAMAPVAPKMERRADEVCGRVGATNRIASLFVVREPLRPATWFSSRARIMRMIDKFDAATGGAPAGAPQFVKIRAGEDLETLDRARRRGEAIVGGLLAVEGFYWASAQPDELKRQVEELRRRGVRMVGLTQRASNHLAGSSEDCDDRGGLSALGEVAVREIWRRGMSLDLAHASSAVIADVAKMARGGDAGAIVVSHVGFRRTCDRDRNLSDEDARNVARAGGVIGLGYWSYVACWSSNEASLDMRERIVGSFVALHDVLSEPEFVREMGDGYAPTDHIAFGSDFDGATTMPFDTTGLPWLIEGLASAERQGARIFDEGALAKIAGGNLKRILAATLAQPVRGG